MGKNKLRARCRCTVISKRYRNSQEITHHSHITGEHHIVRCWVLMEPPAPAIRRKRTKRKEEFWSYKKRPRHFKTCTVKLWWTKSVTLHNIDRYLIEDGLGGMSIKYIGGWCHKNGKLLLVYEYMRKGSLDMHLFTETGEPLSWTLRHKILADVASALHYLHYEYDQKVVHRDIKASNIMLDSDFNARVGDFGLARAIDNEKTSYAEAEGVLGTIGYIAPECFLTGKATQHSDIYAFGALLIEVVSGQRPGTKVNGCQFMVDYVWSLYREGRILDAVDQRIADDYDKEEAQRFLLLGLACSHPIASERPKTHTMVQILSGSTNVPHVSPFKPSFVWPEVMPIDDLSLATSIDTT